MQTHTHAWRSTIALLADTVFRACFMNLLHVEWFSTTEALRLANYLKKNFYHLLSVVFIYGNSFGLVVSCLIYIPFTSISISSLRRLLLISSSPIEAQRPPQACIRLKINHVFSQWQNLFELFLSWVFNNLANKTDKGLLFNLCQFKCPWLL